MHYFAHWHGSLASVACSGLPWPALQASAPGQEWRYPHVAMTYLLLLTTHISHHNRAAAVRATQARPQSSMGAAVGASKGCNREALQPLEVRQGLQIL